MVGIKVDLREASYHRALANRVLVIKATSEEENYHPGLLNKGQTLLATSKQEGLLKVEEVSVASCGTTVNLHCQRECPKEALTWQDIREDLREGS